MKRALIIMITLTLFLGLAGCGSEKKQSNNSSDSNASTQNKKPAATSYVKDSFSLEGGLGDIVTFGSYEQDNNTSNGTEPIQWIVLDKESDGTLVLISKYALDTKPYNVNRTSVTWEDSSLRKWLNNDFCNVAFSTDEQAKILITHVINENNPNNGTPGGNDTNDRVFLLSINEVTNEYGTEFWYSYFTDNSMRLCVPSKYAVAHGAGQPQLFSQNPSEAGYWWLRSSGYDTDYALCVRYPGDADSFGTYVDDKILGVRPVIRVRTIDVD